MRFHLLLALTLALHQGQFLCHAYPPTLGESPAAEGDDGGGGGDVSTQPSLAATHLMKSNRKSALNAPLSIVEEEAPASRPTTKSPTAAAGPSSSSPRLEPHFVYEAAVPQQDERQPQQQSTNRSDVLNDSERDEESSKKIIGSSVVTSVSVILNGDEPEFRDAVGHKVPKPEPSLQVASPINLLNPDRYEFFTFDDNGELVKRLMTMQEIQSIVANGDGEGPSIIHNAPITNTEREPEKNVQDIVDSVQTVLNKQVEHNKNSTSETVPILDTPDVSSSWSMILPAIFGNTGGDIFPQQKPQQISMTPEAELVETSTQKPPRSTKKPKPPKRKPGQKRKPTTTSAPTITKVTAETPQVVQEELDPHESVYTGIQQYQHMASNLQGFEAFSTINHQHIYQKSPANPESTTRRVFINNQEIVQISNNREPTKPATTTITTILEELPEEKKPVKPQHKHSPLPHRNESTNDSNHLQTTQRPGPTHNKQKIKKKPASTTTFSLTTPEPKVTISIAKEPIRLHLLPSQSSSIGSLPTSTQTPGASLPTKKKKKKPTPPTQQSLSTALEAKPTEVTSSERKPASQTDGHYRPRPTIYTSQPNKPYPAPDSVADSTIRHDGVTHKNNYRRKRPRPSRPTTTTTTTVRTSVATATTAATTTQASELVVGSFPGFGQVSMQPISISSQTQPIYAPVPAYPVPATYQYKRHPPPSPTVVGSSSNNQKIQSLSTPPQTQPQQQSIQPDEDANTKLSIDQIMLSLKEESPVNREKISEDYEKEDKVEKPISEDSTISTTKHDSLDLAGELEVSPSKVDKVELMTESFSEVTPLSIITSNESTTSSSSFNNEKIEDMTRVDVISMRPELATITKEPEYITIAAAEPLISAQPHFGEDKTITTTNFTAKATTTKSPIITGPTKIDSHKVPIQITRYNPAEKTAEQATEGDFIATTAKIPEEKTADKENISLGQTDNPQIYPDVADPVVSDFMTAATTSFDAETDSSSLNEETTSDIPFQIDLTTTELAPSEPIAMTDLRYQSSRLPVTTLHQNIETVLEGHMKGTENTEEHSPLVADMNPFLNINIIKPTERITMNDFQTAAATAASALVDRTSNLSEESSGNSNETTDELASLISDVIQQMKSDEENQEYKPQATSTEELTMNRLTNFAHLNTSFLLGERSNSSLLSTFQQFSGTKAEQAVTTEESVLDNESTTEINEAIHSELLQNLSSDSIYPQTTILIPSNEDLIKTEEEYLETIQKTTLGPIADADNFEEEPTETIPLQSHSQISAAQEHKDDNQASAETVVDQGHELPDDEILTEDINGTEVSDDLKEQTQTLPDVKNEEEEFTTISPFIEEAFTTEVNGLITEDSNYEELDSMTDEFLSQTLIEKLRDTNDEIVENFNTQPTVNSDKQTESATTDYKQEEKHEGLKDMDSIPDSTKVQHQYSATESFSADGLNQVEEASYIPVRIEEYKPGTTDAEAMKVQEALPIKTPTINKVKITEDETKIESQEHNSEIEENISTAETPADSITASAEKIIKNDETLDVSVHANASEDKLADISSEEGYKRPSDSFEVDPYIKLGELTAKPVVVPSRFNNTSAERYNQTTLSDSDNITSVQTESDDLNESIQPVLMENNYEAFISGHREEIKPFAAINGQELSQHEPDEEDEEDQGGFYDDKTTSTTIVRSTTTTKATRTTRTTPTPLTSTTTKRLMTLKPVSYFKQPSFSSYNQAEPQKVYTYGSSINPLLSVPLQQQQQQRPMHRPPALSNLMHSSTQTTRPPVKLDPSPEYSKGLEASTANLDEDLLQFTQLCNELAFSYWRSITSERISSARSLVLSPFALTSMLSMVFLGARGGTSGEMNEVLKLDDMVTFNPHLIFKNVTDSVERATDSDIATAAFVREIFSDRANGKILQFFKEKTQQLYSGHVEEVNFHVVNDIIRRRTNLLMKRHTMGKVLEYLRTNSVWVNGPLATISANLFQTDCSHGSTVDRDGEMFFQVHPSVRQRRLVPIAAVLYKSGFTAGYEPQLDATVAAFGQVENTVSIVYLMPGHQSSISPADNLDRLERQLIKTAFTDNAWSNVLTSLMDRPGLEVQVPRFSHRSFVNASLGLQKMGLRGLFQSDYADLRGLTGSSNRDVYLSDMIQINTFSTCGEDKISDHHHVEMYPAPPLRKRNKDVDANEDDDGFDSSESIIDFGSLVQDSALGRGFYDDLLDPKFLELPLPLRPRQARVPDTPSRLRFDKPFLYFVRHNPTGLILFMGRFNPRLLP